MIYSLTLIFTIFLLILWKIKQNKVKEGFYTLFTPFYTNKKITFPNYSKYTKNYDFKLLKIGATYKKNEYYAIDLINNIITNMLSTALISKVQIFSKTHDYILLEQLNQNNIDLAIVSEPVMLKIMINDKKYINTNPIISVNSTNNLQFLSNIGRKYIFIVTLVKTGIENIYDLIGKNISIGEKKSASWIVANDLFNYLNYDLNKIETPIDIALLQLYNEKIDAILFADYYPNQTLINMTFNQSDDKNKKFRIIPINHINTNKFETEYFYYRKRTLDLNKLPRAYLPVTIDNNKYNQFNPNLITFSFDMMLITSSKLNNKTAYTIVKTIHENKKITNISKIDMSITFVPIELHKGAKKYYFDKNYITKNKNKNCIYFIGNEKCNDSILADHHLE